MIALLSDWLYSCFGKIIIQDFITGIVDIPLNVFSFINHCKAVKSYDKKTCAKSSNQTKNKRITTCLF